VFRTDRYVLIQDDPYLGEITVILVDSSEEEPQPLKVFPFDEAWGTPDYTEAEVWGTRLAEQHGNLDVVRSWECCHCGEPPGQDFYMVHDEVWEQAEVPEYAQLHLTCLEERIGRPLVIDDFTDAPVNRLVHFGYSLKRP
jgi:hypothetical protein